jgi:tRNA pseudouridine38-40 synthase
MRNIRLTVAYDGTDFYGWQRQSEKPTVQGLLESAAGKITGEEVKIFGSGRTDAGVHAANQVANFQTSCPIPCENLVKALNHLLPASVRVKEAREAASSFHARNDARSKTYRYRILLAPIASPFIARFVYHYPFPLDWEKMARAAEKFQGEHDFASFAAAGGGREDSDEVEAGDQSEMRGSVRMIFESRLSHRPRPEMLVYEVRGSGFLHHMVRNIVGTLVEIGRGKIEPGEIEKIVAARDRSRAGPTAPAQGLCLWKVEY